MSAMYRADEDGEVLNKEKASTLWGVHIGATSTRHIKPAYMHSCPMRDSTVECRLAGSFSAGHLSHYGAIGLLPFRSDRKPPPPQ